LKRKTGWLKLFENKFENKYLKAFFMDEKGFLATADAIFGLLITFILVSAVLSSFNIPLHSISQEINPERNVQDVMGIMATSPMEGNEKTILSEITIHLISQNNSKTSVESSGIIVGNFLNKTAPGMKYNFTETNNLKGSTIVSNGDMTGVKNFQLATRHCGNYSYQLYFWK
jgi:hypothetical protein